MSLTLILHALKNQFKKKKTYNRVQIQMQIQIIRFDRFRFRLSDLDLDLELHTCISHIPYRGSARPDQAVVRYHRAYFMHAYICASTGIHNSPPPSRRFRCAIALQAVLTLVNIPGTRGHGAAPRSCAQPRFRIIFVVNQLKELLVRHVHVVMLPVPGLSGK